MSNNIYTGYIVDPNIQQPFLGPDIDFLINAYQENAKGVIYGMLGENLYAYQTSAGVAVGGAKIATGGNTLYLGWIYFQNEIFYCPGATGINSYVNGAVFLHDNYFDASIDPVQFSDSVYRNIHQVRRLKLVDQAPGSGIFDLAQLERVVVPTQKIATTTSTVGAGAVAVTASSFTTSVNRPTSLKITIVGRMTGTADGANECGGVLRLYNVTTNTNIAQNGCSIGATVPNTQVFKFPISVSVIYKGIPANTTLEATIQNNAAGTNITIDNCYISYEEVLT